MPRLSDNQIAAALVQWTNAAEVIGFRFGYTEPEVPEVTQALLMGDGDLNVYRAARTDLPAALADLKEARAQLAERDAIVRAAYEWWQDRFPLDDTENRLMEALAKAEQWFCYTCHWSGNRTQLAYDHDEESLKCPKCGAWSDDMSCFPPFEKEAQR